MVQMDLELQPDGGRKVGQKGSQLSCSLLGLPQSSQHKLEKSLTFGLYAD